MTKKDSKDNLSRSINEAINNMNFNEISEKIKTSVDTAIQSTMDMIGGSTRTPAHQTRNPKVAAQKLPEKSKASGLKLLSLILTLTAFGMAGTLVSDLLGPGFTSDAIGSFIGLLVSGIGAFFSWDKAKYLDSIGQNYIRFLKELGPNTVIPIRDLASSVQQSEEETINDLLYMMKNGYFFQARIVENDSLFLLDIPTFKLYKNQAVKLDRKEEKQIQEGTDDARAQNLLKSGGAYLGKIRDSKKSIRNGAFLQKVESIEKTIVNILDLIKKYPDKAYALDKFMDYYLPTTVKLIDTYIEFEAMSTGDKKILESMDEIDKSISTINEAFEKIQVELLSDRAMDIKTDIDTMRLLLNQEGLLEDDWSEK